MCADSPDTSGQQKAALMQAELSKEQLEWVKQLELDTRPEREAAAKRAAEVSDVQMASMKATDARATEAAAYHKSVFEPLERKIATEAGSYDTPERREAEAAQAQADMGTQADLARSTAIHEAESRGVDPSSPAYAAALARSAIGTAAAKAAAGNQARKTVETVGAAKLNDAASLGRGIASAQGTTAQLALAQGNSSVVNANSALGAATQGATMMNAGYGGAQSGLAGAGRTYGDIAAAEGAASSAEAAGTASLAGAALTAFAI